jgi:hypothetical protein
MSRRLSLLALAIATLALGACAAPTAPRGETTDSTCATGAVTNGSHGKC